MKYYNFLAKAPGTLVVGGSRHRLNAGETLKLPEALGRQVTEGRASGHPIMVLVSTESVPDKEPEKPQAPYKEPEESPPIEEKVSKPESEPESKPDSEAESQPEEYSVPFPGSESHWSQVREYLEDLEAAALKGEVSKDKAIELVERVQASFEFKSIKKDCARILEALK